MPLNPSGKPCGVPHTSPINHDILQVLQNSDGESAAEIRHLLRYRYCKRTVLLHLRELRDSGKIECYIVTDDMRKPRYRVVKGNAV